MSRLGRERFIDTDHEQISPQALENNELERCKFKFVLLVFTFLSVCVMLGANYLSTGVIGHAGVIAQKNFTYFTNKNFSQSEGWQHNVSTKLYIRLLLVALVVLLLGGIIVIYLDETRSNNVAMSNQGNLNLENSSDQLQLDEFQDPPEQQRPTQLHIPQTDIREMSPPPYHIAIRLASQSDLEEIRIYDEQSPPPPYEKAVT